MCFVGPNKPKIATEDIPCYKVMLTRDIYRPKWWQFWKKTIITYKSYYKLHRYRANEINPTIRLAPNNSVLHPGEKVLIKLGYHSYHIDSLAKEYYYFNKPVVRCIIPKGSIYFENELGEYVSSDIIITDKLLSDE